MYSRPMNPKFSLASTAALIADPARAAMLTMLLDARPHSAGELARVANTSAQSASMHLSQLLTGGFLCMTKQGRHRYYSIANHRVAHAVEALGVISNAASFRPPDKDRDLCFARTCYDHLAGELGVKLTAALERDRVIVPSGERDYELTKRGEQLLACWKIDAGTLKDTRRAFARRCLDWTERRYHLAGALGAAICGKFLELRWITRGKKGRIVHLSLAGRRELAHLFRL
jgi:DNA-binding transcriptional ArsR family regulator